MKVSFTEVKNILTRASGYLKGVCSHSLQPYRGCSFGRSLCGAGCYVRHNRFLTRGRPWGSFLEVRRNAAESYRRHHDRERRWARASRGGFSIFLSSATEPFLPQESRYRVTQEVLEAMAERPPDQLILQTHTHRVADHLELLRRVGRRCHLRAHLSVETDRETIPGLPPPASPVEKRLQAAGRLKEAGLNVVVTVSPLLPVRDPEAFFQRIAENADAVVIDHFIQGDGTPDGSRTRSTPVPEAMRELEPRSADLAYREEMVEVARRFMPGRVGVSAEGFAGRYR